MTSPISNDPGFGLGSEKAQGKGKHAPAEVRHDPAVEGQGAPAPRDDQVTLSEAGRKTTAEATQHGEGPNSPEEAQQLVEQVKEQIAANPSFAAAAHEVSDDSALSRLLDSFA